MKSRKDDICAFLGTLCFHAVLMGILWFSVLRTEIPEDDGGVLVNFGNADASTGLFEPGNMGDNLASATEAAQPPASHDTPSEEELLTQDTEETVSLDDAEKRNEEQRRMEEEQRLREERERQRQEQLEAERRRQEEEQQQKLLAIQNQVAGAFGIGSAETSTQGSEAEGTGNQGSPFGNSDHGADDGIGGYGSFNLNGRSIGAGGLPRPVYTSQVEGRIVVDITVNPKGDVIYADIGRGTNIENASMRQSAIEAARKAKFNSISGANNQSGTITYIYKLK